MLHLAGSYVGSCGETSFAAGPGDIGFAAYGLPFSFEISAFRALSLVFPRSAAPPDMKERALHGPRPPMSDVATRLLANSMRALHEALPGLTNYQAITVAQSIVALADGARARVEISQRLQKSEFSPEQAAKATGASRSALYALLEGKGSFWPIVGNADFKPVVRR